MKKQHLEHEEEPLDLGLFEMMMGMTPEEWDAPVETTDNEKTATRPLPENQS
jgi:hypothetical protein